LVCQKKKTVRAAIPSKNAIMYFMLDVQPFLLPQRLLHRDYSIIYNRSKEDGTNSKRCCDSHAVL